MTSNVGAQFIDKSALSLGFQQAAVESAHTDKYKKIKDLVMDSMKKTFRPEFLNRIDEIIVFQQLTREEIRRIVDIMSSDLIDRNQNSGNGYGDNRRVQRHARQRWLQPQLMVHVLCAVQFSACSRMPLAEQVLAGTFKEGDTIEATLDGEIIKFQKAAKKAEPKKSDKAEKSEKAEKAEKAEKVKRKRLRSLKNLQLKTVSRAKKLQHPNPRRLLSTSI